MKKGIHSGMNFTNKHKYFLASLALLVVPISGLSIDIYVPSLPAVSQYFGADKALTQLTITTYMIGLGIMQLFAGGISDSYGRRKPFLAAMLIYIIATLLVPLSHNIHQLLFLRLIQGTAVALTVVPMRSVISDLFEDRELYKMMNYMTMAWSIGPIIAPAIGGYLQHFFGWQTNFYFLAAYSTIIFILTLFFLPETSVHKHPFHLGKITMRYFHILFHWEYATGLMINGALYSLIILFSIVGPFLIQTVLHFSAVQFGHISLLMGLAWFLGTITNGFILDVPLKTKAKMCLFTMFIISIVMFFLTVMFPLNIYSIVIPIFFILWTGGIIFPNYFARNITLFPETTGSANALFGSFVFLIAGMSSALGTLLKSTSELPLNMAYIVLIVFCLVIYYVSPLSAKKELSS